MSADTDRRVTSAYIPFSCPKELAARIRAEAEAQGRPVSWLIRDCLKAELDARDALRANATTL
jgi:Ribbon-helix-helix protein, copG family